jgi:exonuclease SbcC
MIPLRLKLKNFLSYRDACLDFRGLHTACVCGANGAGKSSLLEAIGWALWGESRAATEDDVIHLGATEAQVDFIFMSQNQRYRVIRTRHRGQATGLEFQIDSQGAGQTGEDDRPMQFRSLTVKGLRATQQVVLEHLKLDYDTFVNSAYLRQGHADEFMLKRPIDRKQILADLLKLEQYDELAERAKDQARQLKGQLELLERSLAGVQSQIERSQHLALEQATLEHQLAEAQQQQQLENEQLQRLRSAQQQRQSWHQQLTWHRQHQQILTQDCQRLQQELAAAQQQQQDVVALLQQQETIAAGFAQFQTLQAQEEIFATRFQAYQLAQTQRQAYQHQQTEQATALQGEVQRRQAQIEALVQQSQELERSLTKRAEIEAGLVQLQQARTELQRLDRLQAHVSPLLQRQQQLQLQRDRLATRLLSRLEELQTTATQLKREQSRQPQLQQSVLEVGDRIAALEQQRLYQQQVRDRGLERRSFMERLQAHQRDYETQLAEVEQKIQLLKQEVQHPAANGEPALCRVAESDSQYDAAPLRLRLAIPYPPCPLCDRPLDEHHWNLVLEKHQVQQQEILDQIWTIREQLAASEREIQVLRQEYRSLDQELASYGATLEQRGQLQAQLQTTADSQVRLQQVLRETAGLEQTLQSGDYAADLHEELGLLERRLAELNYDERDHAIARGQVDRWRWAEIKQEELKQALRKQAQIAERLPGLEAELQESQQQLEQLEQETRDRLAVLDQRLTEIGYDLEQHNQLRVSLRQMQVWQLRYQELQRAQESYPVLHRRAIDLAQAFQERQQHHQIAQAQVQTLVQQLEQIPNYESQVQAVEQRMQERRSQLDQQIAALGRLQQQQQQRATLEAQAGELMTQIQRVQRQWRVYQELAQAFGKNGIQTLMIENVLPQLEAETNQILSRLSANQLHVQFVTQRAHRRETGRSVKSKAQTVKPIETLDILIADAQGTRPYETYSGGEAFRVNFAIRLALSRLLAQRSGTALQLLIIDEGFGTQDAEGCDRLIAAINAIAADFACILTVTHVPHFKEAFQSRIEVYKTQNGSEFQLTI